MVSIPQHVKQILWTTAFVEGRASYYNTDRILGEHALIILSPDDKQSLNVTFDACMVFKDTMRVEPHTNRPK